MFGLDMNGGAPLSDRQKIGGAWGGYAKTNDGLASGLVGGTLVATAMGWRPVEAIAEGDLVLTFDGGLQPVRSVIRGTLWRDGARCPRALWPLHVPAGALGNEDPMQLLPEQAVLVESDTADLLLQDPFAMMRAASLVGFRGIERVRPVEECAAVQLVFDEDEVVFAASGALVHCPTLKVVDLSEILSQAPSPARYRALSEEEAALLVDCIREEDAARPHSGPTQEVVYAA